MLWLVILKHRADAKVDSHPDEMIFIISQKVPGKLIVTFS